MILDTPPHILLLEDHGVIRAAFKALLLQTLPESLVYEAANYVQATRLLVEYAIDFAFLDFNLADDTEQSGLDVLEFIRTQGLSTRAVILSGGNSTSGYLDKELVLKCLAAGAFGYIPKALEGDGLFREAFETVLQGRIFLPTALSEGAQFAPQAALALNMHGRLSEVLFYLSQGCANKIIAERMQLSEFTVRNYVSELLKQFKVKNRAQLIIAVARLGIVIPTPSVSNG